MGSEIYPSQMLAVQYDQEMFALFDDGKVIMPGTGVASFIHKVSPAGGWNSFVGIVTWHFLYGCRNCCQRIPMPTLPSERSRRPLRKKQRRSRRIRSWLLLPSPAHLRVPNLASVRNTEFLDCYLLGNLAQKVLPSYLVSCLALKSRYAIIVQLC